MNELKPCPFCGGEATAFQDNYKRIAIVCEKCNLFFGIELECGEELVDGWRARIRTADEAVKLWNRRTENGAKMIEKPNLQLLKDAVELIKKAKEIKVDGVRTDGDTND